MFKMESNMDPMYLHLDLSGPKLRHTGSIHRGGTKVVFDPFLSTYLVSRGVSIESHND